jgi:predicted PP-loop superfamily ATPase
LYIFTVIVDDEVKEAAIPALTFGDMLPISIASVVKAAASKAFRLMAALHFV